MINRILSQISSGGETKSSSLRSGLIAVKTTEVKPRQHGHHQIFSPPFVTGSARRRSLREAGQGAHQVSEVYPEGPDTIGPIHRAAAQIEIVLGAQN